MEIKIGNKKRKVRNLFHLEMQIKYRSLLTESKKKYSRAKGKENQRKIMKEYQ